MTTSFLHGLNFNKENSYATKSYQEYPVDSRNIKVDIEKTQLWLKSIETETTESHQFGLANSNYMLTPQSQHNFLYTLNNSEKLDFVRGFTESFFQYYKKKFYRKNHNNNHNKNYHTNFETSFSTFFLKYYKKSFILFSTNKTVLEFVLSVIPNGSIEMYSGKSTNTYYLKYSDNNALDFLHILYKNTDSTSQSSFLPIYNKLCSLQTYNTSFSFTRTHKDACIPEKVRASDSGYDLTLISKIKTVGNVDFYDTFIQVEPPFGYYFDLVGRSSISKSGYILANSFGVIDRTYRGNIIVPLIKIDKNANDLVLPNKLVQIIPRHIIHLTPIEASTLQSTERNTGGFGSTDKIVEPVLGVLENNSSYANLSPFYPKEKVDRITFN